MRGGSWHCCRDPSFRPLPFPDVEHEIRAAPCPHLIPSLQLLAHRSCSARTSAKITTFVGPSSSLGTSSRTWQRSISPFPSPSPSPTKSASDLIMDDKKRDDDFAIELGENSRRPSNYTVEAEPKPPAPTMQAWTWICRDREIDPDIVFRSIVVTRMLNGIYLCCVQWLSSERTRFCLPRLRCSNRWDSY